MTLVQVWSAPGCPVPRLEWAQWLSRMLSEAVAAPERVCSVPECHDAKRKLCARHHEALVELAVMHDAEIAELNAAHLGCAGPTNILSFPAAPEESGLGVLAFGLETWLREAALYGQKPELHAQRLLAHGLAHLLGHDHGPEMDACCLFLLGGGFPFSEG